MRSRHSRSATLLGRVGGRESQATCEHWGTLSTSSGRRARLSHDEDEQRVVETLSVYKDKKTNKLLQTKQGQGAKAKAHVLQTEAMAEHGGSFHPESDCDCSSRLFHLVSSLQDWPDMVLKKCCVQSLAPSCHVAQLCSAVFKCVQLSVVSLRNMSPVWVLQKGKLLLQDGGVCHLCLLLPHPILLIGRYSTKGYQRIQSIQGHQVSQVYQGCQWSKLTCPCF